MAYASASPQRLEQARRFDEHVLRNVVSYKIPVIVLKKETPKEAVCTVFEKVNTGGVALDVFELLTATFASDNFRLKDDWTARKKKLDAHPELALLIEESLGAGVEIAFSGLASFQYVKVQQLEAQPAQFSQSSGC